METVDRTTEFRRAKVAMIGNSDRSKNSPTIVRGPISDPAQEPKARIVIPVGAHSKPRSIPDALRRPRGQTCEILWRAVDQRRLADIMAQGVQRRRIWWEDPHLHDLRGTPVSRLALSRCAIPEVGSITGTSLAMWRRSLKRTALASDHEKGMRVNPVGLHSDRVRESNLRNAGGQRVAFRRGPSVTRIVIV
jgi:hypothetical protein